ncbi:hypothetical protein HY469_02935 [Candidatus Roizmanbacteria bacterium]|nr:hypothetical protein [Candidatus Roizmanbacteria bacterium]
MRLRTASFLGTISKLPWKQILLFTFLFIIFLLNAFHEEYPDEYDNIVGGKYILEGRLPYRDWFSHHQPLPYFLSYGILLITGISFVRFRIALAIIYFLISAGSYFLLKKRIKESSLSFYLFFLFAIAFGQTYYWGNMLLADTLSAYLLIPAIVLVLMKGYTRESFTLGDLSIYGLYTFFAWLSSITVTYVVAGLHLYVLYLFIQSGKTISMPLIIKKVFQMGIVIGIPYLVWFLYLLITGSIGAYYFDTFTFNQQYYIYNYPVEPGKSINPIRYALIIAHDFFNNFYPALISIKNFALDFPLVTTFAVSHLAFTVILLITKRHLLLYPFLLVLIYSNSRSNPSSIRETDYQVMVYILLSIFIGTYSFQILKALLDSQLISKSFRMLAGSSFILLSVYWFFTSLFLPMKFFQKFMAKYSGQAPLIYDYPEVAPIVNQIADEDEYVWMGPLAFKELLYINAQQPSKYHWFLNHSAKSEKIRSELIAELSLNRPKVIVFDRDYAPWGGDAESFNSFFREFLDENYFRIFTLNEELDGYEYRWKIGRTQNYDIDGFFYFDRNRQDEILQELLDKGLLEQVTVS